MAIEYPNFKFTETFCSEGEKTLPPVSQISSGNGRTSLKTGFPPECQKPISTGGLPPERSDFNGVLNALSQWAAWNGIGGSAQYDAMATYKAGCQVFHKNRLWLCVKESTGNEPAIKSQYWEQQGEITGTIKMFASGTTPAGYLPCDGSAVLRSQYPDLFAVIGTAFGGSGQYFNVPNLVNKFAMGASTGVGQYVEAGLPNITGNFLTSTDINGQLTDGCFIQAGYQGSFAGDRDNGGRVINFDASRSSKIYGKSKTVQPPAVKVGFFIRY